MTFEPLTVFAAADLSLQDRLRQIGFRQSFDRGDTLCRAGETPDHVQIVASGFVVGVKRMRDGQQQNVALFLPGDIVGHELVSLGALRCDAVALSRTTTHKVSLEDLRAVLDSDRTHVSAFWRHVAYHGALAHEWLLNLGRRAAYARTAHLLCEIVYRTETPQGGETRLCQMPLTQTELADTLGLSVVHVNRTLMRLKDEGLIRIRRGQLDVLHWPRLQAAAGFDPDYLTSRAADAPFPLRLP